MCLYATQCTKCSFLVTPSTAFLTCSFQEFTNGPKRSHGVSTSPKNLASPKSSSDIRTSNSTTLMLGDKGGPRDSCNLMRLSLSALAVTLRRIAAGCDFILLECDLCYALSARGPLCLLSGIVPETYPGHNAICIGALALRVALPLPRAGNLLGEAEPTDCINDTSATARL